jgi:hypothetical protein
MNIKLPYPSRSPGIITEITQVIDVSELGSSQFSRLRNAARRGYVFGNGYVAGILTALASVNALMAPVVTRKLYSVREVSHELLRENSPVFHREIAKELMDLSDVRFKFQIANDPERRGAYRGPMSQFIHGELQLVGWHDDSPETLRKEVLARLNTVPGFRSSVERLTEIVETKPRVTVFSETR